MTWAILVPIIKDYGIPLAKELWTLWKDGKEPTLEDWAKLESLGKQTATNQMNDALIRAGIDPASDKGQALLDLTK
jgi:hypothetical protein